MSIVPGGNGVPGGAAVGRTLDRVLSVQRPAVLAHIRTIRRAKPDATPAQVIKTLERRYLAAVTTGGALVGATAAIPAVGTVASLALSTAETAGFLEASALFALSVTEVHSG
jgi:trimethylamine:corrinoid methyltransferase-like protein